MSVDPDLVFFSPFVFLKPAQRDVCSLIDVLCTIVKFLYNCINILYSLLHPFSALSLKCKTTRVCNGSLLVG